MARDQARIVSVEVVGSHPVGAKEYKHFTGVDVYQHKFLMSFATVNTSVAIHSAVYETLQAMSILSIQI